MNFRLVSSYILGLLFLVAGVAHFSHTWTFMKFLPDWFPAHEWTVWISGGLEIVLGAAILFPKTRSMAALGILILLILYTPLHVIDLMRHWPIIGSKAMAWARLPIQLVMIYMAYLAANWDKD